MTVSPERIEEAREKLRRAVEDGERLYRKGMHDPDGLTAKDEFRINGILSLDLPDALGAYDRLAAALCEAQDDLRVERIDHAATKRWLTASQAEVQRLQERPCACDECRDCLAATEIERLREALGAYRSALRSGEPESDRMRVLADAALAPADEATP